MRKFIFQISKYNSSKSQLRLKERYNKSRDTVTTTAMLHLSGNTFLSGMHYAYQDVEGNVTFSFNKSKDVTAKVDVNVNFTPQQLEGLQEQIDNLGTILTRPPVDDDGVSELQGYQLHVVINDAKLAVTQETSEKYGDKIIYKIKDYQVQAVKIVTAGDESYIEAPGARTVDIDMAMKALYDPTPKHEVFVQPTTVEETKAALLDFSRARTRGAAREYKKAQKALLASASTSTQIILVDDDDEQPE